MKALSVRLNALLLFFTGYINFEFGDGIYFEEDGSLARIPPIGADTEIPKHLI